MTSKFDLHVRDGSVSFEYDEGFLYVSSDYYIDGSERSSLVQNAIGVQLQPAEIDKLIDLLKEYKKSLG